MLVDPVTQQLSIKVVTLRMGAFGSELYIFKMTENAYIYYNCKRLFSDEHFALYHKCNLIFREQTFLSHVYVTPSGSFYVRKQSTSL